MRGFSRSILVVLLASFGLALVAPTPAGAATINVTTTTDEVVSNGQTSLREAFVQANANGVDDTIVLSAATTYTLDLCGLGPLLHSEANLLTIQGGAGTVLENLCEDMQTIVVDVEDADLTVDSLEMTGVSAAVGPDQSGVAIAGGNGASTTIISNSSIHGFDAGSSGYVVHGGQGLSFQPQLQIINSQIWGNTGRAVRISDGGVQILGSQIYDQTGGGVTLTDGRPLTIANSSITNNGGVGVRTTGQADVVLDIFDTTISGNADAGVSCGQCNNVSIAGSAITNNGTSIPVGGYGGGGVTIDFAYNEFNPPPAMSVVNSTIDGNLADRQGGGIHVQFGGADDPGAAPLVLTVDNTSVSNNETTDFFDNDGGGIAMDTGSLIIQNGSVISGNTAGPNLSSSYGGGVYQRDDDTLTTPPTTTITDSTFENNEAGSRGGSIALIHGGIATVSGSLIADSQASGGSGGGIAVSGTDLTISSSTIRDNTGSTGGGVALLEFSDYPDGSLTVEDSTISGNSVSFGASGGGGIWVNVGDAGADALVRNSTVTGNSSLNFGGGIMVMQTSRLTLDHATVVENTGVDGANVWTQVADFTTTASVIALPQGAGDNCGTFTSTTVSGGFNFADDTSCSLGGADLESAVDPELGALADNGGPTLTRLPSPTSPVGGLVPAPCTQPDDQRGVARPLGDNCDAGAVEIAEDSGPEPIMGTDGNDVLRGTPGDDIIIAGAGNDTIFGGGGNDIIISGPGRDFVFGGPGDDEIDGNGGRDFLIGGSGNDIINGGTGRDILIGGRGTDALDGGGGRDFCILAGGSAINC